MIGDLLDRIRGQYIAQFKTALDSQTDQRLLSEVVLRNEQGQAAREGTLELPIRIDLVRVEVSSAQTLSVNSEKIVTFSPITFMWSKNLEVCLQPFQWDGLSVHFAGKTQNYDWKPLVTWFGKWFKEEEDGDGELLEAIHFLSDPSIATDENKFDLDLGTAPVAAFEQLLDAFESIGVKKLRISVS